MSLRDFRTSQPQLDVQGDSRPPSGLGAFFDHWFRYRRDVRRCHSAGFDAADLARTSALPNMSESRKWLEPVTTAWPKEHIERPCTLR
jgi:hypothetical protein